MNSMPDDSTSLPGSPAADGGASPVPGARWTWGRAALVAGLAFLLGGLAAAAYYRSAPTTPEPGWGDPIVLERFDDAGWRDSWVADSDEAWRQRDGRLISSAPQQALLILRQRLTPPVAIEYTGQILPGQRPCDLSVWWSERENVPAAPALFAEQARSWMIQAGANENSFCAIMRQPGSQRVAYNAKQLESGRDYRFRVEIDGEWMTMSIDGAEVLRYRDRFPTTSGYLALYGYFPGKAFDDIAIWQKSPTGLVPAVAVGDGLFSTGHFADAAVVYARLAEGGGPAGQQALFRKGLAERRAGRADLSSETWSQLTDPELAPAAAALRLEDLFATGQHDLLLERLAAAWQRHPSCHDDLRQQWQQALARLLADWATPPALLERYLAARDQLFASEPASARDATLALDRLGRFEDILRRYPDERRACIGALISLGRLDEAGRQPGVLAVERLSMLIVRGDYQAALVAPDCSPGQRATLLCKLGRAAEIDDPALRIHPALIHLGRASELLKFRPLSAGQAREALLADGRFEEAAGTGLADVPDSGGDWRAMLQLGRIEDAVLARREPMPWLFLLRAMEAGDQAAIKALRPQVPWRVNLGWNSFWFAGLVIAPMADRMGGDAQALTASLRKAVQEWGSVFGQRAWFLARCALGEASDAEVLAMPATAEAQAWLHLGKALRAELADQPAEARTAYQAFTDLPRHLRLLDNHTYDIQAELFVQWRLRALGR